MSENISISTAFPAINQASISLVQPPPQPAVQLMPPPAAQPQFQSMVEPKTAINKSKLLEQVIQKYPETKEIKVCFNSYRKTPHVNDCLDSSICVTNWNVL